MKNEMMNPGHFACPGCGEALAFRHVLRTLGRRTVVVATAGCGSVVDGYYPITASKVPFFHCSFGTAATTAAGVKAGLEMRGDSKTIVLAWAGDGGTFDIGFQALSGAAERNEDILYVCYDNEAYMNTGVQRSSATPKGAITTTSPKSAPNDRVKKDIVSILAAHNIPYLATSVLAYPEDLERKVRRAKAMSGFRFLHVLVPCPPGWSFPPDKTITLSRLAVLSRVFPLIEVVDGKVWTVGVPGQVATVREYVRAQGRFKAAGDEEIVAVQASVDEAWTALLKRADGRQRRVA